MGADIPAENLANTAGGDAAAEVADRLTALARRIRRDAHHRLGPLGVTPAQVRALRTITRADRPVRMGEIAEALGIAGRSATSLVDALESAGLAVRTRDVVDRRSVLVAPSSAGVALLEETRRLRHAAAADLLGDLTPDELSAFRTILERLDDAPDRGLADPADSR